jgi:hypothetical protein
MTASGQPRQPVVFDGATDRHCNLDAIVIPVMREALP